MAERIVVIGAGGFGRETLDVVEALNAARDEPRWDVVGVVDDATAGINLVRLADRSYLHLGSIADNMDLLQTTSHVVAIGSPIVRAEVHRRVGGQTASALIHPAATVGSAGRIADGVVVCAGAHLSTNVTVGSNVHVNPGAIVGHDTVIADFVSINPGAVVSGDVALEQETLIGAGAVILQGLRIGTRCIVGAGACVTKDVPEGRTVMGVPAR